jgi:predicted acetyltransferase
MFQFYEPGLLIDDDLELIVKERYPGNTSRGWAPSYRFSMVHQQSRAQVGEIELRIGTSEHLCMYAGHIGYEVYRPYRGHHYAARSVLLLLPLARRYDLTPLWITCNPDNYASRRTCELAGFEFVEIVDLPLHTDLYREGERQKCRYRRYL